MEKRSTEKGIAVSIVLVLLILVSVLSLSVGFAIKEVGEIGVFVYESSGNFSLTKGENRVFIDPVPENETESEGVKELNNSYYKGINAGVVFRASDLTRLNPEIEVISWTNSSGEVESYAQIFGGIGKDFPIIEGQEYEIFVKEDIELKFN